MNPSHLEVLARVTEIAAKAANLPADELPPNTNIQYLLQHDSLGAIEFTMELEQEFGVPIPDETAQKLRTLGDAAAWINAELQKRRVSA